MAMTSSLSLTRTALTIRMSRRASLCFQDANLPRTKVSIESLSRYLRPYLLLYRMSYGPCLPLLGRILKVTASSLPRIALIIYRQRLITSSSSYILFRSLNPSLMTSSASLSPQPSSTSLRHLLDKTKSNSRQWERHTTPLQKT
jgi:hypothetical protein